MDQFIGVVTKEYKNGQRIGLRPRESRYKCLMPTGGRKVILHRAHTQFKMYKAKSAKTSPLRVQSRQKKKLVSTRQSGCKNKRGSQKNVLLDAKYTRTSDSQRTRPAVAAVFARSHQSISLAGEAPKRECRIAATRSGRSRNTFRCGRNIHRGRKHAHTGGTEVLAASVSTVYIGEFRAARCEKQV